MRIHAGTDGTVPPALPAGLVPEDWNFGPLDSLIAQVKDAGAEPVLNIRYAPNWMWTCASYYATGQLIRPDSGVVVNPVGTQNRLRYLEIWNEPDISSETPCSTDAGPALVTDQYVAMWNVVAAKARAVDSQLQLIGPVTANEPSVFGAATPADDYIARLVDGGSPSPNIVSFHAYGGWMNSQSDAYLFDGDGTCCGLRGILAGLARAQPFVGSRPIWITELNVNADYGNDPALRPARGFGAAWGASAFRGFALGGVSLAHNDKFVDIPQFGLVGRWRHGPAPALVLARFLSLSVFPGRKRRPRSELHGRRR